MVHRDNKKDLTESLHKLATVEVQLLFVSQLNKPLSQKKTLTVATSCSVACPSSVSLPSVLLFAVSLSPPNCQHIFPASEACYPLRRIS